MAIIRLFLSLLSLLLTTQLAIGRSFVPASRKFEIVNESGHRVAIDWINPLTGESIPYSDLGSGQRASLDSFVNHTFVLHHLNDQNAETNVTYVTVTERQDQVVVLKDGWEVERTDDATVRAIESADFSRAVTSDCHSIAKKRMAMGVSIETVTENLISCLEGKTAKLLEKKNEELAFQSNLRKTIASLAENYTCADPTMETTTPQEWRTWTHNGVTRDVGILHNRPSSQIHILKNFISREECDAIEQAAKPTLHRGTVADGKGGSRMSENRKAWQAGLKVDWEKEGDLIAAVSQRLFDYTNYVTGYNMSVVGQEDLMSIQYFGNGVDDPMPDRYTPHCDGDCDGLPHKRGGRVATMVMYCDVPELGGATNFQNANVYVKPEAGAAAFFSYMNPITMNHEEGFTSHSGCPVLEGTKRIAVQWMRVGVDAENPWNSFDTNTIRIGSCDEDEKEEEGEQE